MAANRMTRDDQQAIYAAQVRAALRPGARFGDVLATMDVATKAGHDGDALYREAASAYRQTSGQPAPTLAQLRATPAAIMNAGSALATATQ